MSLSRSGVWLLGVCCQLVLALVMIAVLAPGAAFAAENTARSLDDFKDATFAVVTGSAQADLVERQYPDATRLFFNNSVDVVAAVASGKADATCQSRAMAEEMVKTYPELVVSDETLGVAEIAFPFPRTSRGDELRGKMDELLGELRESGQLQRIHEKWVDGDDTTRVMPDIQLSGENGVVRVCVSAVQYPFSYYLGDQVVGYGPEILMLFCERFGYTYEIADMGIDAVILSLQTEKYDFSVSGVVVTSERSETMNFSVPYDGADQVLVYRGNASASAAGKGFWEIVLDSVEKTFLREDRWRMLLGGLGVTLLVAACSALLGTLLGYGIALARYRGGKLADRLLGIYVNVFQGTPVLVMLLIFYYVVFGAIDVPGVIVSIIVFSLNAGAYISENIRTGIQSVPRGQTEAALALGYDERAAFRRFVMPQAVRRILPVYRGELISLLKGTSIVGYIAVQDLTKAGDIIRSRTYEAFFPLISVAVVYFLLAWLIFQALKHLEKRLDNNPDKSKRVIKGVVEHD